MKALFVVYTLFFSINSIASYGLEIGKCYTIDSIAFTVNNYIEKNHETTSLIAFDMAILVNKKDPIAFKEIASLRYKGTQRDINLFEECK